MGSTLSQLKTDLTAKLAQSNTGFHSNDIRESAINEAVLDIAMQYEVPELIRVGTLTVASGVAAFPTSFLRMVKLWDTTNTSLEYLYIVPDEFDGLSGTSSSYWTIDYNVAAGARKILVRPNTITSANIRYMITPTVLVNDADETELPTMYDQAISYKAAAVLYKNEHNPVTQMMQEAANAELKSIIQAITPDGGVKANSRLRSVYEKYGLLN